MNLISYYCKAHLYHATSTTAVFYGISAITLILLTLEEAHGKNINRT